MKGECAPHLQPHPASFLPPSPFCMRYAGRRVAAVACIIIAPPHTAAVGTCLPNSCSRQAVPFHAVTPAGGLNLVHQDQTCSVCTFTYMCKEGRMGDRLQHDEVGAGLQTKRGENRQSGRHTSRAVQGSQCTRLMCWCYMPDHRSDLVLVDDRTQLAVARQHTNQYLQRVWCGVVYQRAVSHCAVYIHMGARAAAAALLPLLLQLQTVFKHTHTHTHAPAACWCRQTQGQWAAASHGGAPVSPAPCATAAHPGPQLLLRRLRLQRCAPRQIGKQADS